MITLPIDLTTHRFEWTQVYNDTISSNTDTDSSAVDLQDYEGPVHVQFSFGNVGDASTTIVLSLRESTASAGIYSAVSGVSTTLTASASANDNVTKILRADSYTKRYLKARVTTSGGTASVPVVITVIGRLKRAGGTGIKTDG